MSVRTDQYGNVLSTDSAKAAEAYSTGLYRLLAAQADVVAPFEEAIAHDPQFALAHVGLARALQTVNDAEATREAMATAKTLSDPCKMREQSHIHALDLLVSGKTADAYTAIRAHVSEYPRDAMVAQTCSSIFGLIGFSGQPGREAEMLAFNAALLPHYGKDDWWCQSQYAFALCETGNLKEADAYIDRSLALNPDNANGAHIRSHIWYEAGETKTGADYLTEWLKGYDRSAVMHGHLSWHVALWSLEQGDTAQMWQTVDADVAPGAALGLPINVLTDTASILFRAEIAGETVAPERWQQVSAYASRFYPKTSNAFIDMHAALAHAMAGKSEPLQVIIDHPVGPAADLVPDVALACRHIAAQDWAKAAHHLTHCMADHARIGGSRAQRDLLEHALLTCLLRQDRATEARQILALRRPVLAESVAWRNLTSAAV
ncbi:tetratricopeptide repeat protein [uncultured Roseovarius sp.]|uniref:tetratricopeptide repeat protein n=1 Tax=uncultured Roseovarius sp. TaxID=293344 RepID=UPI00262AD6BB|nr:tetratricopeptide repeat protein [uncultured Roseovarius sp.]